jgi:hypothetical protein
MAEAIMTKVDTNEWACMFYDWRGGSWVLNPSKSGRYARDIAGPRLAAGILAIPRTFKHIHLIGHSSSSMTVSVAAQYLAKHNPDMSIHITLLDAYTTGKEDDRNMGKLPPSDKYYVEHYYVKDAGTPTETDFPNAHNVNLSEVIPSSHVFPYKWYQATILGQFDPPDRELYKTAGGIEYGFARGLEVSQSNWQQSLRLKRGNKAIVITK